MFEGYIEKVLLKKKKKSVTKIISLLLLLLLILILEGHLRFMKIEEKNGGSTKSQRTKRGRILHIMSY